MKIRHYEFETKLTEKELADAFRETIPGRWRFRTNAVQTDFSSPSEPDDPFEAVDGAPQWSFGVVARFSFRGLIGYGKWVGTVTLLVGEAGSGSRSVHLKHSPHPPAKKKAQEVLSRFQEADKGIQPLYGTSRT